VANKSADELLSELGEMESEEAFIFPPDQRRLVTQPVDLSVQTLTEQWDAELLYLPDIQREYVWDNGKASRLIESLLLNIPIPVLYFAETPEARYEIIDGHQRVKSIVRFLANEFSLSGLGVLTEYRGLRFHQLPEREQRFLKMRTLRAVIISADSHPNMKFEIFERLNTGAISLNAQELRNSIYRGAFNDLLHLLAENQGLRSLIGTKAPRKRMVDEELILRFFALRSRIDAYRPPLKRFLNDYMALSREFTVATLEANKQLFERTVAHVYVLLGPRAFRVTDENGRVLEKFVNRALFEAQMVAVSWIEGHIADDAPVHVRREFARLFADAEFLDAIQRATGDRSRTLRRLRDTVTALRQANLDLLVPFDLAK
jgi:hypothetical protein